MSNVLEITERKKLATKSSVGKHGVCKSDIQESRFDVRITEKEYCKNIAKYATLLHLGRHIVVTDESGKKTVLEFGHRQPEKGAYEKLQREASARRTKMIADAMK